LQVQNTNYYAAKIQTRIIKNQLIKKTVISLIKDNNYNNLFQN